MSVRMTGPVCKPSLAGTSTKVKAGTTMIIPAQFHHVIFRLCLFHLSMVRFFGIGRRIKPWSQIHHLSSLKGSVCNGWESACSSLRPYKSVRFSELVVDFSTLSLSVSTSLFRVLFLQPQPESAAQLNQNKTG